MFKLFLPVIIIFTLISCRMQNDRSAGGQDSTETSDMERVTEAEAVLQPTQGNNVKGKVTFTKEENGIKITADVEGLKPGKHGFHIHETGDCSAPDGSSAGGHFNPAHHNHGAPTDSVRHIGDLGNLEAGKDGKAHLEWLDTMIAFEGTNSIVGKAVIVHEKVDDYKTQPTGNAGGRLACGVIESK